MFDDNPADEKAAIDERGLKQTLEENIADPQRVTLDVLQTQLKPWSLYNFGLRPPIQPLLGMIEETGEACTAFLAMESAGVEIDPDSKILLAIMAFFGKAVHAHLKSLQSIRGSAEDHAANHLEQISNATDIINAYYFILHPSNGKEVLDDPWEVLNAIGLPESKDTLGDGMADLLVYTADLANAMGVNLTDELDACWKKVRQRDWVAHRRAAQIVAGSGCADGGG